MFSVIFLYIMQDYILFIIIIIQLYSVNISLIKKIVFHSSSRSE